MSTARIVAEVKKSFKRHRTAFKTGDFRMLTGLEPGYQTETHSASAPWADYLDTLQYEEYPGDEEEHTSIKI